MFDSYTSPGFWLKLFGLCDGKMDSLITGLQSAEGIYQVSYFGETSMILCRFSSNIKVTPKKEEVEG